MKLSEFLEEFLPDYAKQYKCFVEIIKPYEGGYIELLFNREYFEVALENYTDLICKKQREMCANAYLYYQTNRQCYDCDGDSDSEWMKKVIDFIDDTPQPNPDDLCA